MVNHRLSDRIFVAGHRGMVGSAIVRKLEQLGYKNIFMAGRDTLDLVNQTSVDTYFKANQFDQIYMAAAKVGGIHANHIYPAEFIYQNLMIESNIIHAAHQNNIQRLLFLGSSCIYPKLAHQPMQESALLNGYLEPTNEPYAIAKIAGIKLCESYHRQYGRDYRSVMLTNLYGPFDNFHAENSHVIPALLSRFHEAKCHEIEEVVVWGSGNPMREFLYVEDMAEACIFVMNLASLDYQQHTQPMLSHVNVGTGQDCTIKTLAQTIAKVTGFAGRIIFDATKPDGTPRKLLDVSRINSMGWQASTSLEEGLSKTYAWFLQHQESYKR